MARLFGSSGVRGLVNIDLKPALACKVGLAVASHAKAKKALVARDTRVSGLMLENGLISGLLAGGADVFLLGSVAQLILLLIEKKPKFDMDEFTLHSEGYYTHPKYRFEICPECLHSTPPAIVPISKSSGPWKCVGKGHTIPVKAACVGSDPPPRRTITGRQ